MASKYKEKMTMSRISKTFETLGGQGRKALVTYITAGDPHPQQTLPMMHAMVDAGADIIELGVPFSDPMADGPVIQAASERALKHHVSLHDVLDMVSEFRHKDTSTPVVLMGYLNPVEAMGYEAFARAAADSGVDGVLTVDLPPDESEKFIPQMQQSGIDTIFLLAPTSSDDRIEKICRSGSGFVYYVSLKGVTGAANLDVEAVTEKLAQIRQHTDMPIGVGFGIKDAGSAGQVARIADAVVVGSAIVRLIEQYQDAPETARTEVMNLLKDMRQAMDAQAAV
jgi:tryptophan synthase alpha chain